MRYQKIGKEVFYSLDDDHIKNLFNPILFIGALILYVFALLADFKIFEISLSATFVTLLFVICYFSAVKDLCASPALFSNWKSRNPQETISYIPEFSKESLPKISAPQRTLHMLEHTKHFSLESLNKLKKI